MKLSPSFKHFESQVTQWTERIYQVVQILQSWLEVQRKWIYLESIFIGNQDIKAQLSNEYRKFGAINRDFIDLMSFSNKNQNILLIVQQRQNLLKQLEQFTDSLDQIQKSL